MKKYILLLCFILSACGFRSMYDVVDEKLAFDVSPVKYTDEVKNDLIKFHFQRALDAQIINSKAAPNKLDILLEVRDVAINIQSDYFTARQRLDIIAYITITDKKTDKLVYTDKIFIADSYEVGGTPLTSYVAKERLGIDLVKNLAQELKFRLFHFTYDN